MESRHVYWGNFVCRFASASLFKVHSWMNLFIFKHDLSNMSYAFCMLLLVSANITLAVKRVTNGMEGSDSAQDDETSEDGETLESEHLLLNGSTEDEETAVHLQNFMDSLTTRLLERTRSSRAAASLEHSAHGKHEEKEVKVSKGGDSFGLITQSGDPVASLAKQSLLQEMSEPTQEHLSDQKSVEC